MQIIKLPGYLNFESNNIIISIIVGCNQAALLITQPHGKFGTRPTTQLVL